MINPTKAWEQILDASGLSDLACEYHGHDLLDGLVPDSHGRNLAETFEVLCNTYGVREWADLEPVLADMRTIDGFEHLRIPDEHADLVSEEIGIPDHTSISRGTYSCEWGTPGPVIEIVRKLYGPIDVDLASNAEANETVQASAYYTAENPCPKDIDAHMQIVWCNPPGPSGVVKEFWAVWNRMLVQGNEGGFLIFKQDHWRMLPPPRVPVTTIVLRKRLSFVRSRAEIEYLHAKAEREGKAYVKPTGANFPSTLVLSGILSKGTRKLLSSYGHVQLWEPL